MTRPGGTTGTVALSQGQVRAVATEMVARTIRDRPDIFGQWEDVPALDEQSWEMVSEAILQIGRTLAAESQAASLVADEKHIADLMGEIEG